MNPTVSCNSCGYVTFMPSEIDAEDWMKCPECGSKQRGKDCTTCKAYTPGKKPFIVTYVGVNAKFKSNLSDMNSSFEMLLKKYEDTQLAIAEVTMSLEKLASTLYKECASKISIPVMTANNITTESIARFITSPYTTVTYVTEATAPWLDTPKIVIVPELIGTHLGVPLGASPNGSRFYLVSNFTLMQYRLHAETVKAIDLEIPLSIAVGMLHISGADMDVLEDAITSVESLRKDSSGMPGRSGISPLSAATNTGGAISGANYRTAEVVDPVIAALILGSVGVPIKSCTGITKLLTSLKEIFDPEASGHGVSDPNVNDGEPIPIERQWLADIAANSNCHLIGGSEENIGSLIKMIGLCSTCNQRRATMKSKSKILYIGKPTDAITAWSNDDDNWLGVASMVNLLDQEDYDDAEIIIVNGEQWVDNPDATNMLVTCLAITNTPVCVWTNTPDVDLLKPFRYNDVVMSCIIMRYIASLCPFVSGDIDAASRRPLQFVCNSLIPVRVDGHA